MQQIDPHDIYGTRILVFLETEPQSNTYHQVLFTPEEFKRTSLTIGERTGKEDKDLGDEITLKCSVETYKLPDLKEIHGS